MKATIDRDGRIELGKDVQAQLGVQPGDDVFLEARGDEVIIKAANGKAGLGYEGNVLVHRGTCVREADSLADDRDERMKQLSQGLPK